MIFAMSHSILPTQTKTTTPLSFPRILTVEDNADMQVDRWHEVYDNQVTKIDIDLSSLAGQSVQFVLGIEASSEDVSSAQGFWFVPRIER